MSICTLRPTFQPNCCKRCQTPRCRSVLLNRPAPWPQVRRPAAYARFLRACHKRPADRCAADKRDELAPLHVRPQALETPSYRFRRVL